MFKRKRFLLSIPEEDYESLKQLMNTPTSDSGLVDEYCRILLSPSIVKCTRCTLNRLAKAKGHV